MAHSWYVGTLAKNKDEEQKEAYRRKKDDEQLEIGKSRALQISDLDREISFIIRCIQFLISFIYFDTSYNVSVVTELTFLSVLSYESLFVFFNSIS